MRNTSPLLTGLIVPLCLAGSARSEPNDARRAAPDANLSAPITIFRDPERYATFPDVNRLPDGSLLCVFRDATFPERVTHIEPDARPVAVVSKDHGRTWSKPEVIYDDPHCQNDPSVAVLRDGRLLLTFFNWVGRSEAYVSEQNPPFARRVNHGEWGDFAEPGGVFVSWGQASPLTWSGRAQRVVGTHTRLYATSARVLETQEGTLLLPIYGRTPERLVDRAFVLRSTDGGKSWSDPVLIAVDPEGKVAMREPALAQMPDGTIVTLLRTADADDHLYTTWSEDDGLTWAPVRRTPLIGHPTDLLVLPDGRLLAVYGYRHEPFGVRACISEDGRTWDRRREIIIADHGAHWDLGYPSACLTADGHVLVAYYMNGPDTRDRWIECRRIPPAVLR